MRGGHLDGSKDYYDALEWGKRSIRGNTRLLSKGSGITSSRCLSLVNKPPGQWIK